MTEHAMIAFLPSDDGHSWCKQDLAHMTLVYAGETDRLQSGDFNKLAKDAISAGRLTGSFVLQVTGVEEFGDDAEKVDVLTFHPTPQLLVARKMVEHWNASQYKDFKPHATIGPVGSAAGFSRTWDEKPGVSPLPSQLYFNRVGAFWGDKQMVFKLGDY